MHNIKKAYISILTASAVGMGIYSINIQNDYQQLKSDMSVASGQHEIEMELQKAEYLDVIIEIRQDLLGTKQDLLETQFNLDMATDHIELINAGY
jgi:hypothetical protein